MELKFDQVYNKYYQYLCQYFFYKFSQSLNSLIFEKRQLYFFWNHRGSSFFLNLQREYLNWLERRDYEPRAEMTDIKGYGVNTGQRYQREFSVGECFPMSVLVGKKLSLSPFLRNVTEEIFSSSSSPCGEQSPWSSPFPC